MRYPILAAALLLGGCATAFDLAVMPRDSGKIYTGTAHSGSGSEGPISITIEGTTYNGTWVQTVPSTTTSFSAGYGWGGGWGWRGGAGGAITMDNPNGGESKALLSSAAGAGLRCDFRGGPARSGGGVCRDDRGREYDVQIRPAARG